ncbi:MAG: mechanosensitive ion channel family protein [Bacteroidales bacterium]|nr:mechanosensitive ion channel family protein [Bacteroidales bacterium]
MRNIGKRPYIRRIGNVTVTYDTPPDKLQQAIDILKEILENHEGMKADLPPRVYFNELNSASLNIMFLYWYHPPDYWAYMSYTEKVNLEIIRRFNAEGIDFAFPTQTLYLAGDDKRPLNIGIDNRNQPGSHDIPS